MGPLFTKLSTIGIDKKKMNECFYWGSSRGETDACKRLMRFGVDVNYKHPANKWSALHVAAFYKHQEHVKWLISIHANVNNIDIMDMTPLHDAVLAADYEMVKLLLSFGADQTLLLKTQGITGYADLIGRYQNSEEGNNELILALLEKREPNPSPPKEPEKQRIELGWAVQRKETYRQLKIDFAEAMDKSQKEIAMVTEIGRKLTLEEKEFLKISKTVWKPHKEFKDKARSKRISISVRAPLEIKSNASDAPLEKSLSTSGKGKTKVVDTDT